MQIVATSQLKGILGLRDFDAELHRQLVSPDSKGTSAGAMIKVQYTNHIGGTGTAVRSSSSIEHPQ
jgi:hypothetical protein